MSKSVEFYFDVGSPASYLASTQLPGIAAEAGAELVWKPVLLGGIFKAVDNASPMSIPVKGAYVMRDFERYARRYGVPIKFNMHFMTLNTLMLMRGAVGLQINEPALFLPYVHALFKAIWVDGVDGNDPGAIARVLSAAGLDAQAVLDYAGRQEVKDALRANTDEAIARGLFGLPVMFVGKEMFFGQDRLEFVREALHHSEHNHV